MHIVRQVAAVRWTIARAGYSVGEIADANWILLAGFIGCGLIFAGLTGLCPPGWVIARMPETRRERGIDPRRCPNTRLSAQVAPHLHSLAVPRTPGSSPDPNRGVVQ